MSFGSFQGKLRPLVEAAWNNHAGLLGVSTTDKSERDAWYRDNLWAACRIKSSKDASELQRRALLAWFAKAAGVSTAIRERVPAPVAPFPAIQGWSSAQSAAFWKLANAARRAAAQWQIEDSDGSLEVWVAERLGGDPVGARKAESGAWSLGTATDGFDQAMSVLAVSAGDLYWIDRTSAASERRLRYQIDRCLADLSWLEGEPVGWSYVEGIYIKINSRATLPGSMDDCPAKVLLSVLQVLDTQIRRLCSRMAVRPCLCPTRPPADPALLVEWRWFHSPTPGHTRAPDGRLLSSQACGAA
jgi:hypothetical protein